MVPYSTNLTDKQWQVIENIVNTQERSRKYSLRGIVDAIFCLLKTGCQWRMLPSGFAPWESVYYYFRKWKNEGVIEKLLEHIHLRVRKLSGKAESSSMGIIDSRSVKTSHHVNSSRGIDGSKKIKGRKQHIIVDTLGFPMPIAVHEANILERSFAWLENFRRLTIDYEYYTETAETMIQLAFCKIMRKKYFQ